MSHSPDGDCNYKENSCIEYEPSWQTLFGSTSSAVKRSLGRLSSSSISYYLVGTSDVIKSPNKMAVLLEITIVSIGVSVKILNFAQELTCLQNYCLAPRSSSWKFI